MYVRIYHTMADPVRVGCAIAIKNTRQVRRVLRRAAERHVPEGSRWSFVRCAPGTIIPVRVVSDCGLVITLE